MKKKIITTSGVIAGAVMIVSSATAAINCAVPPSCESMGYVKTALDCQGQSILKCPFDDSKVYCGDINIPPTTGQIYYSDGTVSDNVISSKTPVGVVVNDGSVKFAVSFSETSKVWGVEGTNIKCLNDCEYTSSKIAPKTDMHGANNTRCILWQTGEYPAASYCNTFSPVGSGIGSSGWYLPAAGELVVMSENLSKINATLFKLSKTQLGGSFYWSSSERDADYSWSIRPTDIAVSQGPVKSQARPVRCFHSI